MPKKVVNRFTAAQVKKTKDVGKHLDGQGLYLQVTHNDRTDTYSKSWLFRYLRKNGKNTWMGLGSYPDVSLADAREAARWYRKIKEKGDPLSMKRQAVNTEAKNFTECRELFIASKAPGWRNGKHRAQWENTLKTYAEPIVGHLPVDQIDTTQVLDVLTPIWDSKTETATRVRQRMESVLDYATALKFRSGENPARWRGHLDKLLANPTQLKKVTHHPALPYEDMQPFMERLRDNQSMAARALELTILTATRTNEVIGAKWEEFDLTVGTWVVPASRMKANRDHTVPLSKQAVKLLKGLPVVDDYVFPGRESGKHISNMAMLKLLKRLPFMASGRHSEIGARSRPTIHGTWQKWRWRTLSRTRRKLRIDAVICWRNGGR
jgi:integrase